MFNLIFRSIAALGILFGLFFAAGLAVIHYMDIHYGWALVFACAVILLLYAAGPFILDWVYRIKWIKYEDDAQIINEPAVKDFIVSSCKEKKIPLPRLGIIEDPNPNALTYGHYPGNARIILTTGLIKILDKDELSAVIGHELGHIYRWDFIVLTLSGILPFMLYLFSISIFRSKAGHRGGAVILFGVISYTAYTISEYIILPLSRLREYYADRFSSELTAKPNSLASSLVKIAYGLAVSKPEHLERGHVFQAGRSFGIFDPKAAKAIALNTVVSGGFSMENMVNAMKEDIANSRALYHEFLSSHPLPARRMIHLQKEAQLLGQATVYDFTHAPESEKRAESLRDFFIDIFFQVFPFIGLLAGIVFSIVLKGYFGLPLFFMGLGYLLKLSFAFPKKFKEYRIEELVKGVKASFIRSIPSILKGKVIYTDSPGAIWEKGIVLQDKTGFIPLVYKNSMALWGFTSGFAKLQELMDMEIELKGWFRRPYNPYFEIFEADYFEGEKKKKFKCYFYDFQIFLSVVCIILGALLILVQFGGV